MLVRHLARSLATAGSILLLAIPAAQAEVRGVLELFTSQGCSSCPPADKLLADLTKDRSLIVMSLAVDYWDYLGWKDTLALAGHTRRQQAYAKARGDREVYTPQAVVNGSAHVQGSDRAAIENAMVATRKNAVLSLPVTLTRTGDKISVSVPAGPDTRAEVWLCPITDKVTIQIERGENRGNSITYHNVVRRWIKLGDFTGKAESWTVSVKDLTPRDETAQTQIDSYAVIVQSGVAAKPGPMLGAAMASVR